MGLFKKKKQNRNVGDVIIQQEKNEMNNSEMKALYGDYAILLLKQCGIIEDLNSISLQMEFGYLFTRDNGETEALFKIIINSTNVYYLGVQKGKVQLLNIIEEQYKEMVDYTIQHHECLRENGAKETEVQKTRRLSNNQYLIQKGIQSNANLFCYVNDTDVTMKSLDEICKRAIACLITIQIACDINNGKDYQESLDICKDIYKKFDVEESLNAKERRIVDGSYTRQDAIDMDWAYETYWALCWCLGLVNDVKDASVLCDCQKAINFVVEAKSMDDFKSKCCLRSVGEILDMHDLYFRYNWAINDSKVNPGAKIGNLNPSNVIERRRGLEWVISKEEDWYDISAPEF